MLDQCQTCHEALPVKRDPRRIYCSERCAELARGARRRALRDAVARPCIQCGNSLVGRRADIIYCSDSCSHKYRLRLRRSSLRCDNCDGQLPLHRRRFCSDSCKRAARRRETYGLSPADLAALVEQHSVCAICRTANWGKKGPVVDHDHATGAVRGILCGHCNMGLGRFRDDPAILRAALEYLTP